MTDTERRVNIAQDHAQDSKLQKMCQLADIIIQVLLGTSMPNHFPIPVRIEPTSSLARCDSAAGIEEL